VSWPDDAAVRVFDRAHERLLARLRAAGPTLHAELSRWMERLAPDAGRPWQYFTHVRSFPILGLPWWLEVSLAGGACPGLQEDLALSSMAGYLHVRLVDQVQDAPQAPERRLLPATGVLHRIFSAPYRARFAPDHPFHRRLDLLWSASAEATLADGLAEEPDLERYLATGARKQVAARIPVEAVLAQHDRWDLAERWERFFTCYGRWHQLEDDLFDWKEDLDNGQPTLVVAEARRAVRQGHAVTPSAWMLTRGYRWGFELLDRWWPDVLSAAEPLGCPPLLDYLDERETEAGGRRSGVLAATGGLEALVGRFAGGVDPR